MAVGSVRIAIDTEPYDLSPDGRRFLMMHAAAPPQSATQIHVVLNWFEGLK